MEIVQLTVVLLVQINLMAESTIHYMLEKFACLVKLPDCPGGQIAIVEFAFESESIPSCNHRQLFFQSGRAISSICLSNLMALPPPQGYTTEEPFCRAQ